MKPGRKTNSTSQSCSCTSCIYKSESEQPSVRKYIAHGSRIDRLYYGKYIPLRERKLLNRLVRTRAVYDDLRARLISDSTLSLDKNADLRPRKHHHAIKTLESSDKSGAILELVDFIDKGAALGPKKLSECCSCCSCSSKVNILESDKKEHRHQRAYARTYEGEYDPTRQVRTGKRAFAGINEKEYGQAVHGRMEEGYNKRRIHFKARHVRSDPCTCTLKFSGLIKKHSTAMIRKMRHVPLEEPIFNTEEEPVMKKSKLRNLASTSYQKYKDLQDKLESDMRKLNESKANIKQNLRLNAKKSLEQVKQVKDIVKTNIESSLRKSIQAVKVLQPKDRTYEPVEYPEEETTFKTKKDSVVKFKDYLKRKEMLKDWECDIECIPNTCVPEECFKIIKLRRSQKPKRGRDRVNAFKYEMINQDAKVGEPQLRKSSSSVQAEGYAKTTATHARKYKPMLREDGNQVMGQHLIFETKEVNKVDVKDGNQKKDDNSVTSSPIIANEEYARPNVKKTSYSRRKQDTSKEKESSSLKKDKSDTRSRQAVRIRSSFSFDVEFFKTAPESKTSRSNQPPGTHMTNKKIIQHAPRRKRKKVHRRHKRSQVILKSSLESSQGSLNVTPAKYKDRLIQTNKYGALPISSQQKQLVTDVSSSALLPFECEPFTCMPGECDPNECAKRLSSVKTNTNYTSKSVSSLAQKSPLATADKKISKKVQRKERLSQVSLIRAHQESAINEISSSQKQAVRIGSTFSFNIEFYKNGTQNEIKTQSAIETVKKNRNKRSYISPKLRKVKGTSARAYKHAKTTMRRCFCTLKLHKNMKTKRKIPTSTKGTVTSFGSKKAVPSMVDKYVETKKNHRLKLKEHKLLPYECEPGFCIPGECDPIFCNQILELRNGPRVRHKSKGSYTSSRKTKSTSSIVSRSAATVKAKLVQSSMTPTKPGQTSSPRRYKDDFKLDRIDMKKTYIGAPGRQAVRVGSSFSFNIEFYKNKQFPAVEHTPSTPSISKEVTYKRRKHKGGGYPKVKKHNKSMLTQVINRDKNIGPSLKRCFCTLKLYTNKEAKRPRIKKAKIPTANTQTLGEIPSIGETVNKGTKTKWTHNYNLLPFECEPNICIPGECDPYLCLDKINRRALNRQDRGAFTNMPEMRSMSSFTENPYKRSAAILVQPKLFGRGTNMKENYIKTLEVKPKQFASHTQRSGEALSTGSSKQAVRVGSSFNFSIEFSKQPPQAVQLTKYPKNKQASELRPNNYKNKGIKVAKVRIDHVNTQALEPKQHHKASLVRPMLKRCFCTLNLQKKTKRYHAGPSTLNTRDKFHPPNIYTVSTAMTTRTEIISQKLGFQDDAEMGPIDSKNKMISISTSSFLLKKAGLNSITKYSSFKLGPAVQIPIKLKQPLKINSSLSVEVQILRDLNICNLSGLRNIKLPVKITSYACMDDRLHECKKAASQPCNYNQNKITGISRYLEQCFCAMNVQIANEGLPTGKMMVRNKLKPYECEPGICIPGECNPYECQKAIMRRLARNVHKGSGTKSPSKSISSYATSNERSDSRSSQFQPRMHKHSRETRGYKDQRYHETKQRQAIRVGSSFSFDLEFSKNLSQPNRKYDKQEVAGAYIRKPLNRRGVSREVQSKKTPSGKHGQSQSTTTSMHRATYTPMMKRCFCTLKLQKKGRLHREHLKLNTLPTKQPPSIVSRNVKIGTANAKYHNIPTVNLQDLKAYECEPGICIPGQCDPYKCLERMKRRKDLGINTSRFDDRSVSSMTSEGYPKNKTRAVGAKPKKTYNRTTEGSKNVKINKNNYLPTVERSSRQAVRIGSNFSFNIEFNKGTPQNNIAPEIKETIKQDQKMRTSGSNPRHKEHQKELKGSYSQSSKSVYSRDTQMESPYNQASTMTSSFVRRCFCTAKLQGIEVPNQHNATTFMQKCLCLLGLRNKEAKDRTEHNGIETAEKRTNTNYRNKVHLPPLEPYECEPGICVPGQCDPHVCHKIIQQRMAKQYSKRSETESVRTQSVCSDFGSFKRPRNEKSQALVQKHRKQKKIVKKSNLSHDKSTVNADKRLVRIGSNFSFNVEFYKENIEGGENLEKPRERKLYPSIDVQNIKTPKRNRFKSTGTESGGPAIRSAGSQNTKKETSKFASSPPLKRCFCTLKLLNRATDRPKKPKNINKIDTKNVKITRTVKTQSHKQVKGQPVQKYYDGENLSPYECEPFICVPGECNPVECLERIRKRQVKHFGMITEYANRKSIGSFASSKKRDENLQAKLTSTAPKAKQTKSYIEKTKKVKSFDPPKQAVRIGSNFSFNIEFFKDTGNDASKNPPSKEVDMKQYSKKPLKYHKKVQPSNLSHDVDSQSVSARKQATETGMAHLKRCFCTLQLREKEYNNKGLKTIPVKPNIGYQPRSNHSTVGQFLKKCVCAFKLNKVGRLQGQPLTHAVKYEIKGTSTQNKSPREDRIKKPIRTLEPYECEPNVCVPGECDPYECLKRIQKRQVRDFGTHCKRCFKDSATDSIRRQRTRSTEAQFIKARKLNSRGTSFVVKRRQRSKESNQNSINPIPYTPNRQVVRIGSNFSFNVEFFKEHGLPVAENKYFREANSYKDPKLKTRSEKLQVTSKGSDGMVRGQRCQRSQCPYLKRRLTSSAANTVPKRCFCTLKLLQQSDNTKLQEQSLQPLVTTKNKMTTTKVKYSVPRELGVYECPPLMCIPGECNPYECLDKMRKRGIVHKSRNIGTRVGKTTTVSLGNRTSKVRDHKIQSHFIKEKNIAHHSEPQSIQWKSPRMYQNTSFSRQNKRAVRIGSNFKFNVEFFKEKSQPALICSQKIVRTRGNKEDSKSYLSKNVTARAGKFRHNNSQMDGIKTKNQSSDAANILKRCFCTLQLQKATRQRMPQNIERPVINVRYPQSFTVGRVVVEPFNKNVLKTELLGKANRRKGSKSTNPKLLDDVRSVATKTDKKYLRMKELASLQCDPNSCPDYNNVNFIKRKFKNDMHTILPYTPSKFNKKESKVLVSGQSEDDHKTRETLIFGKGKRLTAKKSIKSIPKNHLETKPSSFLCRCARFFCRRTETSPDEPNNKFTIGHQNPEIKFTIKPKYAKNTTLPKSIVSGNCPSICPKTTDETGKTILKPIRGYARENETVQFDDKQSKSQEARQSVIKHSKMRVTFADNSKNSSNDMHRRKFFQHKCSKRSRLCHSCSVNDCPLKSDNKNDRKVSGVFRLLENASKKSLKKAITHSESADDCQYCECCKRKIDVQEISKGGGDRRLTITSHERNTDKCPCENRSLISNGRKSSLRKKSTAEKVIQKQPIKIDKCCVDEKPLFVLQIDSVSSDIVNKDELLKKFTQLDRKALQKGATQLGQSNNKHGYSCTCCKCVRKRQVQGAEILEAAKDTKNKFGKLFTKTKAAPTKPLAYPCTCGSTKCTIESKKKVSRPRGEKIEHEKPCVCGSRICTQESKKIKRKKQHICTCTETIARRKAESILHKHEREELDKRLHVEHERNEKRRLKRIKRNKDLENRLKKYKDSSDITLAVDSLIDVGKLGVTTISGALRSTAKAVIDPKVAYEKIKCKKTDPDLVVKQLRKSYMESDAAATARRLKMRCLFMKRVQAAKQKLEENRFTHFFLHIADTDPRTREFKRKPVRRRREPLDFQCSLYMASLRRRPCLSIYYKCPWFYPHCLAMMNVWKQFTDIMLFLLAAVVWSPCILCMEGCRALMCCFFCTG